MIPFGPMLFLCLNAKITATAASTSIRISITSFNVSTGILSLRNSASNIIWKIGVGTTMSSGLNNPAIPVTLQSEPTSSTLTYTDENGIVQNFRQGQMAMVGSGNATKFFILRGITENTAYWSRVTTEDDPDYEAYMVHK